MPSVEVDGATYEIAVPLAAVEDIAARYPFLGKLQRRLMLNDDDEPDFDGAAAVHVARVALQYGGKHTIDDVQGGVLACQVIALRALEIAFNIDAEDAPKGGKKKTQRPRSR